MFGCCCGGSELSTYWSLTVWGIARWAGYSPYVLANDNGSGVSSKPVTETLYRTKTTYYEGKTTSGKAFLRTKFGSATNVDWVQVVSTVHEKMADIYYARRTSSNADIEASYDLNDDGSSSGTVMEAENPTGPILATLVEVSRSATSLVVDVKEFGVTIMTVTCTLSTPMTYADTAAIVEDVLDTMDITTPGTDYSPSVATKYAIDFNGSVSQKILCPMPTEYRGTADETYYLEQNYSVMGYSGIDLNVRVWYVRGSSGLTTANVAFAPWDGNEAMAELDYRTTGWLGIAIQGCLLRLRSNAISDVQITDDGLRLNWIPVWKSKAKLLVDGTAHRYTTTMDHSGGPIENVATFSDVDNGTLVERSSYAVKLPGVLPPESFTGPDTGLPGWDTPVYWLPYYIILEVDQATSTETVRGAAIFPSLL